MTYMQKECTVLALVFGLVLATLVFGGMLTEASPSLYLRVGAAWCVIAAALLLARALVLRGKLRKMHGCMCHRCGYEYLLDDETVCADCGAKRDDPSGTKGSDCAGT
ncbi:MAG TPA: hypothetical protein VK157_04490 [Phycisphaerales bacterium]|nr:hypothetical protein [Phycisphaerales bacterium]